MVRQASADAYHDIRAAEHGQLQQFERFVLFRGHCTRAMAGKALDMPANVYSARINKLVAEGVLIELADKAPCEVTGVRVNWLVHKNKVQMHHLGESVCEGCRRDSAIFTLTQVCCCARYVLSFPGDQVMHAELAAKRHGHDLASLNRVICAMRNEARERAVAKAANEGAQHG